MPYNKIGWESGLVPLSKANLSAMDNGIYKNASDINDLKTSDKSNVKNSLTIAGLELTDPISVERLREALLINNFYFKSGKPTTSTEGRAGDFWCNKLEKKIYLCSKITASNSGNIYTWTDISEFISISDEVIESLISDYLKENPLPGTGADGKSAYQIALDNGFEGTETEWLESLRGADAKTPVKGVDYFTQSDKVEMVEYVTAALSSSLQPNYTNQLDTAGYSANTRLNSSGTTTTAEGIEATGFIPFQRGDIIRLKNIKLIPNGGLKTYQYFVSYDSDKNKLVSHNSSVLSGDYTANGGIELDADRNVTLIKTDSLPLSNQYAVPENAAYFRISAEEISEESIITVNEEIKTASSIDVGVVDYVTKEADEVIEKVVSSLGNNTFVLAAITDIHYGNSGNTDGVKHACQALSYIGSRIKLDAFAVLGDYTDGLGTNNQTETLSDIQNVNNLLAQTPFATPIRVMGNHDFIIQDSPIIARYINSYNESASWGSKSGGYFYRDFEDFKLRVIVVNTSETSGDGLYCSDSQYNWFATALDLSAKSNANEWQTLILSHMPLDWFAPNGYVFHQILKAYLNGSNYSNGNIVCDFSGRNSAKIIGNIHGHIHNLLVRDIADGQPNATGETVAVKRIATPEACVGRENSYNGKWSYNPFGEETTYPKTVNTADDTSFCIYCIDLDTKSIESICYGAGYDRTISY